MKQQKRKWKGLMHKVGYLKLDLEDHDDVMKSYESEFMTALAKLQPSAVPEPPKTDCKDLSIWGGETGESQSTGKHRVEYVDKTQDDGQNNPEKEPEVTIDNDSEDKPEAMRKLWKAIASITHPDKTGGDLELTEIYKRASVAWSKGEFDELLNIGLELNVKLPEPDDSMIDALSKKADKISRKISEIESSVLWMWGNAPEDKKDAILKFYLASKQNKKR